MSVHPITDIALLKAATDCGFEIPATQRSDGWFEHCSCRFSLNVWSCLAEHGVLIAISESDVFHKIIDEYPALQQCSENLPSGAAGGILFDNLDLLYKTLTRTVELELSLPHRPLESFIRETQNLPKKTEQERLTIRRIGQDKLRQGLLQYWQNRCAVTGLDISSLLRASHIKPWRLCETDEERLNIYNALLLAPHLDALFDSGYISFNQDGLIEISPTISHHQCELLGISNSLQISRIEPEHHQFLDYHRQFIFKR